MNIITADKSGFCFGVRRAIQIAERAALENEKVYTLGPIIHNPQEVERLKNSGIKSLKSPPSKKAVLILRTHGIPLKLHKKLNAKKDIKIIDAVCPFVKKSQSIVKELAKKNENIAVIGEKNHPEIKALLSYGNKNTFVINSISDAKKLKFDGLINIVSQTTQSLENFNKIVKFLSAKYKTKVYNTICKSTFDRQASAFKLAKRSDLMIVIGGKNSANTRRLTKICKEISDSYHIETEKDLKKAWLKNKKNIGLTAGASTPDWVVQNVKKSIQDILNAQIKKPKGVSK